jgi:hypothetical protein
VTLFNRFSFSAGLFFSLLSLLSVRLVSALPCVLKK